MTGGHTVLEDFRERFVLTMSEQASTPTLYTVPVCIWPQIWRLTLA